MKKTLNAGESFVHSYRPERVFRGDFKVTPLDFSFEVRNKNGDRVSLPEKLLGGGDGEEQKPELTLAAGMLAKHPLVTEFGCTFTDFPIENCPLGVFTLTDNRGTDWTYVLRTAWVGERGQRELKVLYGLADYSGASFGIFDTKRMPEGKYRIKGKARPMYRSNNFQ